MITCSDDGVCPCACNYAVDASCTCRDLAGAIIVTITRPPVVAVYRMKGIRSADFRPYEEVIYMQDNCDDSPLELVIQPSSRRIQHKVPARSGSCGWHRGEYITFDEEGNEVQDYIYDPHSQVLGVPTCSTLFFFCESPVMCTVLLSMPARDAEERPHTALHLAESIQKMTGK